MSVTPTVGRVMWLWTAVDQTQPYAAQVAAVNPDGTFNVGYWGFDGTPAKQSNVPLLGDKDAVAFPYIEWPGDIVTPGVRTLSSFAEWRKVRPIAVATAAAPAVIAVDTGVLTNAVDGSATQAV